MRLLALLRLAGGLESSPISRRVASSNNSGFFIMGRPVFGIRQMKWFMTNLVPGLRRDFHSRFKTRRNRHREVPVSLYFRAVKPVNFVALWKLRYELLKFRLRPRPGGGGANVP